MMDDCPILPLFPTEEILPRPRYPRPVIPTRPVARLSNGTNSTAPGRNWALQCLLWFGRNRDAGRGIRACWRDGFHAGQSDLWRADFYVGRWWECHRSGWHATFQPNSRVKPRQSVRWEPDPPMGPMALAPSQKLTYFRRGAQRRPISL